MKARVLLAPADGGPGSGVARRTATLLPPPHLAYGIPPMLLAGGATGGFGGRKPAPLGDPSPDTRSGRGSCPSRCGCIPQPPIRNRRPATERVSANRHGVLPVASVVAQTMALKQRLKQRRSSGPALGRAAARARQSGPLAAALPVACRLRPAWPRRRDAVGDRPPLHPARLCPPHPKVRLDRSATRAIGYARQERSFNRRSAIDPARQRWWRRRWTAAGGIAKLPNS
jgi:hypothetical protein